MSDTSLTEAEWDSIACRCPVMCPVHSEDADAYIEFATCDLYTRVLAIVADREAASRERIAQAIEAAADGMSDVLARLGAREAAQIARESR